MHHVSVQGLNESMINVHSSSSSSSSSSRPCLSKCVGWILGLLAVYFQRDLPFFLSSFFSFFRFWVFSPVLFASKIILLMHKEMFINVVVVDCFYIALFSALEQMHCVRM